MNLLNNRYFLASFVLAVSAANPAGVLAAPGNISDSPLFLSTAVQPNIFFLVDDSGSMDWEVLKTNGALIAHGAGSNSGDLDFSPNDNIEDLEHCAGYNAMAYDPGTTYTPWSGIDNSGSTFQDQPVTAAIWDPYNTTSGVRNLLNADNTGVAAVYGVWVDADSDGVYDAGECPSVTGQNGAGFTVRSASFTDPRWVFVNTLTAAQQTNYANWYSYYRKREFVAKKALSEILFDSTSRVGLATLHNNNNVGTAIKDVDDITTPVAYRAIPPS